ncbi:NADH:flavin oxidoreductase [Butyrivibrio sp. INlla16]|uniref:oxidoreductase n=1 Tax=Butyrivibrio sp. INlla16 TaxID=1520807 RepID=UPI000883EF72|nr:NADH:flavin oxidoreductase [Butyrivibrio sp. INlla16]SDB64347.1 2,4-dienoyl-CoA reductase [Butyrivibrio sp. INlla16]
MTKVNDSITINKTVIRNRLTMAPTVKFDYAGADGKATEKHIEHYRERAEHGCGLICVEATAVTPGGRFGKNHMGLWDDDQIDGHVQIAKACHDEGAAVIIQLNHAGLNANPELGEVIAPSAVPTRDENVLSKEMTVDEIHAMQENYVSAAIRAKKAGYDGVQLHGCHGYLINQFMSKKTNLRTDEYGGSDVNRARFGAEIIRMIREKCGSDFLISIRTAGIEPDIATAISLAEEFVKAGCDYLQVSTGIEWDDPTLRDEGKPYNQICELGVRFHEHFKGRVPVSCVNGIYEPELAKYLIENELVDTVDLGKAILADPAFCEAVLNGTPFVKCFCCPNCQYGPGMPHKCPAETKRSRK